MGPNAVETWEKENFATEKDSIDKVFEKQKMTAPKLDERDIITYFTGVRPATFEEDFIIEKGRNTAKFDPLRRHPVSGPDDSACGSCGCCRDDSRTAEKM